MEDFSFIRFKPTLSEALKTDLFTNSEKFDFDSIRLCTEEPYLQISNLEDGFSFDGNYEAWLITPCGEQVEDITNRVGIEEFTHSNGTRQFSIEFFFGTDYYYQPLCIMLVHTVSDSVLYSNPFLVTDHNSQETVRLDYRDYGVFEGIDYLRALKTQSIRVVGYFQNTTDETEVKSYYQISTNNTVSARSLIKRGALYNVNKVNAFTFERYNLVLNHNVIYIDGVRITNKAVLKTGERLGLSNNQSSSFAVNLNKADTFEASFQILEELTLITKYPYGHYMPQEL